jgi:hypothetical protein
MEAIQTTKLKHVDHRYVYLPSPKISRGRGEPVAEDSPANPDLAAILAEMQTMQAEMNALRHAPVGGANPGGAPGAPSAPGGAPGNAPGANPGGAPLVPPEGLLDLRDWWCMALEKFDGTGAPIEAADWLSSVVDKLESFQVPSSDWVRYAH